MRVVALEEHFNIPSLLARLPPARIIARGNPPPGKAPALFARAAPPLADTGPARLQDMDQHGITMQVLSWAGPGADLLDGEEAVFWAKACNDALAEIIAAHPTRYAGFAHLPTSLPEESARELERCVRHYGFRGAMINGTTNGLFLDHPSYTPLLACAEALNTPLYLHPNFPSEAVRAAYYGGLPETAGALLSSYAYGWHAETGIHVLRLILSGALDRHPGLKLIIGHAGEYLPMTLARTDNLTSGEVARFLQRPIGAQLRAQVWITSAGQFTLPPLRAAIDVFGLDHVMFSVDYPFNTNAEGRAYLDSLPFAPADLEKFCHGTADALLGLSV